MPQSMTSLLGRRDELERLEALFFDGGARLVTITGRGGTGKTRVAVAVAREISPTLAHGAVFVDLSPVRDEHDVAPAIASMLRIALRADEEPSQTIGRALAGRELLLVLDNFEQVIGANRVVSDLLTASTELRVLVTSRTRLRLQVEQVFPLGPLPVPPTGAARADAFPAVQLFYERAASSAPSFMPRLEDMETVAEICRRLDGLPLAIEIAAARAGSLSPKALLERLGLDVLSSAPDDFALRHSSLRETIRWSHDLLEPEAQLLFRRLAVFESAATLDAIEATCGDDRLSGAGLLDALSGLVDMHLLQPDFSDTDDARYSMPQTVREFARECIAAAAESHDIAAAHTEYYLELGRRATAEMESAREPYWIRRLTRELPDLRAVLVRLKAAERVIDGIALVAGIGMFWSQQANFIEGARWLADFEELAGDQSLPPELEARLLLWRTSFEIDDEGVVWAQIPAARHACFTRALDKAREAGDRTLELRVLCRLSDVSGPDGISGALAYAEEGIALARAAGSDWFLSELLTIAALAGDYAGDAERAAWQARAAGPLAIAAGNDRVLVRSRIAYAVIGRRSTLASEAPTFGEIEDLAISKGSQRMKAWFYVGAGIEALNELRFDDASRWFHAGLVIARDAAYWIIEACCMMGTTGLALVNGDLDSATRLYAALKPRLPNVERTLTPANLAPWREISKRLLEAAAGDASASKRLAEDPMTWPEATALARALTDTPSDTVAEPPELASVAAPQAELTVREHEVLLLIARGGTNKEIASDLGISAKSVMHHSVAIYRKLGVRGRAEATAYAFREGIVPLPTAT